jgi:antitoxin component of MazEF toxin-antitoxin module
MKHVLPKPSFLRFETRHRIIPPSVPVKRRVVESLPSTAAEITPRKPKFEIDDEDAVEGEV